MRRALALCGAVLALTVLPVLPARAATTTVTVTDDAYDVTAVTVAVGDAVTWQFAGTNPHSVTADAGSFDSHPACDVAAVASCATAGEVFALTFATPGRFGYHCRIHPAMTGTVTVAAVPTALSVGRSARTVTYGARLRLTGVLTRGDTGAGLSGEPVEVWRRRAGTTAWGRVATVTSGSGGAVSWLTVPTASADWQLRHPARGLFAAAQSAQAAVGVRVRIAVRLSTTVLETGQVARFDASVAPGHPGATLRLQTYADGEWTSIRWTPLSSASTAAFLVRPLPLGTHVYRVLQLAPDADHLGASTPAYRISVVRRTLRQGLSGSDVLDVERRLAGQRYDVGAVDGYFSYDTTHAVLAFQKVNGLARSGAVDAATWSRLLGRAARPTPRAPRPGLWVEVDLTRQVLYYGRDAAVLRVVDVSTGSGESYTLRGVTYRAVTPTGSFRVQRKIDGWRISDLGGLYRPAYFVGGYAIHGSGSVPPYPDSHGCVRVTIPAMDRLFPILPAGTPVTLY